MTGPNEVRSDEYSAAWLAVAAALLLAVGTSSTDPTPATLLALLALVVAGAAALGGGQRLLGRLRERSVIVVLAVAVVAELLVGMTAPAVLDAWFIVAFLASGVIGLYALASSGLRQRGALAIVVVMHFALMAWMFAVVPLRDMDVHLFQQEASAALLNGTNPYGITFENIYGYGTPLYAPEVQQGDRLTFGFPYPPLSLLLAVPGYALAGDYRFAALAAVSTSALLIGWLRPGRLATGAALLLMFSPLTARVLHNGWTEPFVVLMLVTTIALAARRMAATSLALGLLIGTKQYAPLFLPLALGLLEDVRRKVGAVPMAVIAAGVAAATALPFMLWGLEDFVFSTLVFQILQPFREDGATVAALLARWNLWVPPTWLGFAIAGAALIWILIRARRTPSGFALGSAVVLIAFFVFSRHAFMNYYFVAMVSLLSAVATTSAAAEE